MHATTLLCAGSQRAHLLSLRPVAVETGATSVEYALMAGLITGVITASVGVFGTAVAALFVIPWP